MNIDKVNIAVFSPDKSNPHLNHLRDVLGKHEYDSIIVQYDKNDELEKVLFDSDILFISSQTDQAHLKQALEISPCKPCLAILSENSCWDVSILNNCLDVLCWPCCEEEFMYRLERVIHPRNINENKLITETFLQYHLIGESPSFIKALHAIKQISGFDATTLITGETGTGKELAARSIHYLGTRRDRPFIPVNCGAIPEELFENELFGHASGAYTDARTQQCGLVEQANGGTLFLDEVDALSLQSQVKLLRLLQDGSYKSLGSEKLKTANVRIIAATNADLQTCVNRKTFREDLMFRLNVLAVEMPALRHRPGDACRLAEYFINRFANEYHVPRKPLHPGFITWVDGQDWKGNVRELENTILRAFLLSTGNYITGEHVQSFEADGFDCDAPMGKFSDDKARAINEFEQKYLQQLMTEAKGNISLAARIAGKERRALGKLLQKHHIHRSDYIPS